MTTDIYLLDVKVTVAVPTSILPASNNGLMRPLEDYLGSLYLSGDNDSGVYDSYDIGLSIISEGPIPVVARKPPAERHQLRKQRVYELRVAQVDLMRRREAFMKANQEIIEKWQETDGTILKGVITQCQEVLVDALLVRKFETFSRILRAWNNQLFDILGTDDKRILQNAELGYITKLLEFPTHTNNDLLELVSNSLGLLSDDERSAAAAILPILSQLTAGRHNLKILCQIPTIDEAIADVEQSTLEDKHKTTIIAAIKNNPRTSNSDLLFLPSGSQTRVGDLEKHIQRLTELLGAHVERYLSDEELREATAILPILSRVTTGRDGVLSRIPTIDEGIAVIEQSTLEDRHKTTIIATISNNPKSSNGDALFLPSSAPSWVEDFEKRFQRLTEPLGDVESG